MSHSASSSKHTIYIPETSASTSVLEPLDYHSLASADPFICIDNGSHSWRAGFSSQAAPYIDAPSVVARYRERKANKTIMLFGKDCEVDANSRSNARALFDGDVLANGDMLECALDYTFLKLGIDTPSIAHPIAMTERLTNPLLTRALTSELLFELYGAPAVTYGIDSLFAFSRQQHQDGLAINMGHHATTIIPVVGGRGIVSRAKRIPFGGAQATELMLKLAQLKYPSFPLKVTPAQATFMYGESCYFSAGYEDELRALADPVKLAAATMVVQFPFAQTEAAEKSEEELAAIAERRKESGRRLQEMQIKQRAEKLAAKIAELDEFRSLLELRPSLKKADFAAQLADTPFAHEAELEAYVKRTEAEVRRKQRKAAGEEPEPEEEPSFPLVDRPDDELNEDEVKEKRRQRLMKAGWEARVKLREEKRKERERIEEEKRKEEEERINTPGAWAARLKAEQETVILRMEERKKRRAQLGDRKSAAAQNRMKNIASLAADNPVAKKRKKGEDDDGFGRDDSDWHVYREIGGDEDSDAEEDDQAQLESVEARLLQHEPTFTEADTLAGRLHAANALVNAFVRGGTGGRFDPDVQAQTYQIHLNVERVRVPESCFQPSMMGVDSAGVGEVAGSVLNGYEEELRKRMMQCVLVTGGGASLPGIANRLRAALTPVLPFRAPLKIVVPAEPRFEAWRGLAEWSAGVDARQAMMTRAEYDEHGIEWIKEHRWGNPPP
ncbi:Actin-related protein 5 [Cryptotrichosporon argae]